MNISSQAVFSQVPADLLNECPWLHTEWALLVEIPTPTLLLHNKVMLLIAKDTRLATWSCRCTHAYTNPVGPSSASAHTPYTYRAGGVPGAGMAQSTAIPALITPPCAAPPPFVGSEHPNSHVCHKEMRSECAEDVLSNTWAPRP